MGLTITATPSSGGFPLDVLFAISADTYNTDKWLWEFGDGNTSTDKLPKYTYTMEGTFTATLTATVTGVTICTATSYTATASVVVRRQIGVYALDKCYRAAIANEQGIGQTEYSGSYWPQPPVGVGVTDCVDAVDAHHYVVFDELSGCWFELSEIDGVSDSSMTRRYTDQDYAATGHDIATEIWLPEITGARRSYTIDHLQSIFHFLPASEDDRDGTDYDSSGFLDTQSVDIEFYKDGEQTTYSALSEDVVMTEDVITDRRVSCIRCWIKIKTDASSFVLTAWEQYWTAKDQSKPHATDTTEHANQLILASPVFWATRGKSDYYYDRVGQTNGSGTYTMVTGPDAKSLSAFQIAGANSATWGSITVTNGCIMFWFVYVHDFSFYIGSTHYGWADFTMDSTTYPVLGSYYFFYKDGVTASGIVKIDGTAGYDFKFFDIRIYNGSISTAAKTYLYNDTKYNSGNNCLPRW